MFNKNKKTLNNAFQKQLSGANGMEVAPI